MKLFPILSMFMILSVLLTACGRGASSALAMSNRSRVTNPPVSEDDTRVLVEGMAELNEAQTKALYG